MLESSFVVGKRVLEFLGDGQPRRLREVVDRVGCGYSHGSMVLGDLVRRGLVLASEREVTESYLDERGMRRFRKGRLYIRADSPLLATSPVVKVKVERVRRFTFERETEEKHIRFVSFKEELKRAVVDEQSVLRFFEERGIGATAEVLAEGLSIPRRRASNILFSLHKRGLLIARGLWNPRLGKEVPFMQENLKGFVYGRPGSDDIEKFLESGVLSRDVNIVLNEVLKDSKQKRFTMISRFRDAPYSFSSPQVERAIAKLTQLVKHVTATKIAGQVFLYDARFFDEEEKAKQERFWDGYVRRQKSEKISMGRFHEEFIRQVLGVADFTIEATWWKQQKANEIKYNITLSNGREIDRVLEVGLKTSTFSTTILMPIEAKFVKGGVRNEHVEEFYDKLRTSWEFGNEVEMKEQKQTFKVRILKGYVVPLLITPYITDQARKLAQTLGITVIPTWRLERLASEKLKEKVSIKRIFRNFLQSDLPAKEFLSQIIKVSSV